MEMTPYIIDGYKEVTIIQSLVSENNLSEAIKRLIIYAKEYTPSLLNEVLSLSGRYYDLRSRERSGILSEDDRRLQLNQINYDILNIANEAQNQVALFLDLNKSSFRDNSLSSNENLRKNKFVRINDEILSFSKITKKISNQFSVYLENLSINTSDFLVILGKNGAGKTTLIKCLAGEERIDSGKISLSQQSGMSIYVKLKQSIGYVPQERKFFYGLLHDNLYYTCYASGIDPKETNLRVDYVIKRFDLYSHIHKDWDELSTGFKLRYLLAEALVINPKIIILDEPLANLDNEAKREILNDLYELAISKKEPRAIIITSQELDLTTKYANKYVSLKDGKVQFSGHTNQIQLIFKSRLFYFEFVKPIPESLIRKILGIDLISYTNNDFSTEIETVGKISAEVIIDLLLKNGVMFNKFEDISNSLKRVLKK